MCQPASGTSVASTCADDDGRWPCCIGWVAACGGEGLGGLVSSDIASAPGLVPISGGGPILLVTAWPMEHAGRGIASIGPARHPASPFGHTGPDGGPPRS